MSGRFRFLAAFSALGFAALSPAGVGASAGAQAPEARDGEFGPLIVSARKRPEPGQSVPIAIGVYDQRDLDRLNVRTLEDLRTVAPSVFIAPSTFRQDTINIAIRGQRNFESTGLQFDTATAIYADGVYYARPVGLTGTLFDTESVQVLKGPQGTLVGRNTTGGAILYQSREPTEAFGGYLTATGGDYGRAEMQGALNLPLSRSLAFRAAFAFNERDGYIENYFADPASGAVNTTPGMGYRKLAGLFSLKWRPDDTFSALLRLNVSASHDTGILYHALGYFTGAVPAAQGRPSICNIPGTCAGFTDLNGQAIAPYFSDFAAGTVNAAPGAYNALLNSVARQRARGFWTTEQATSTYNAGHFQTASLTLDKTWRGIDVRWLGAYRWWDTSGASVSRGLPYATNIFRYATPGYEAYQSELTLNGATLSDRLKWTAGLFYFREESADDGDRLWLFLPSGNFPFPASGRQITVTDASRNDARNTSYAAYAQATLALRPDTRLTAGIRHTEDERWAHMETRTIRTPATAATTASVANGVFDPAAYTLNGVSYSGQTLACALTDAGGVLLPLARCSANIERAFSRPTWTLALDHDLFDGAMMYATARSGYRAGAINTGAINPNVIVAKPEEIQDYEVGVKADWSIAGAPVRTNLALYYSDYRNIQIQTSLPNVTIASGPGGAPCTQAIFNAGQCAGASNDNVTLNARSAHLRGVEWDVAVKPARALTLSVAGSYLDARYSDYSFAPPAGYLLPTGRTDLSGTPFPLPQWQNSVTASYELPVSRAWLGALTLTAHAFSQSAHEADMRPYNEAQRTSGYTLANFRLDMANVAGRPVDLAAFVTNAFNREICIPEPQGVLASTPNGTFGIAGTSGVLQCAPAAPRMVGVTMRYRF